MNDLNREWEYALDRPGSAGPDTVRHSLLFAAVLVGLTAAVLAFGEVQLTPLPQFTTLHAGFVFVADVITAFLLFGQFAYRRLPSYGILAAAFLSSALIVIPFWLTFPGALKADVEFLGGAQSSIWIWHIWHTLFPAIIGLSLVVRAVGADRPVRREEIARLISVAVVVVLLLVALAVAAVTVFHDWLPVLIEGGRIPFLPNFYWAGGVAAAVTVAAFVLALRAARERSILHVWLVLVLLALLADDATSLGAYPRYALGWYFGRIVWMVAASILLMVFLTDINRLYQRLAGATRELLDANRRLSAMIGERDKALDELRASEGQLIEADQRKDAFIATLAHELRNPLAPLRNAAHLLARHPKRETAEWATGVIDRQVAQMARLLEDLLDISRIKRNRLELRRERVSLQEVLRAAREQSQPLLNEAKQKLRLDIPARPIYLHGDKVRLAQVFANLLNNAARYTAGPGTVTVDARREKEEVVVRVKDTGIGMEPEALRSIFDMFYQLLPASPHGNGGAGVGLSLVKGLVELHGGSVTAHSEGAGKGSEFTVRLPALIDERAEPAPLATESADATPAERALRVLVVDDNRDNTDSMRALLEVLGHRPAVAYRAHEALALGPAFKPEVILLDIGLPDITGYECAKLIREAEWGRDALLIAMTGWGKPEDKQRAFEAGFDEHLTKPIDLDRLEKILTERTAVAT